jgi:hypothetical protein
VEYMESNFFPVLGVTLAVGPLMDAVNSLRYE